MLRQLNGKHIKLSRFYTGEIKIEPPNNVNGSYRFEWLYNPTELDTDLLTLQLLNIAFEGFVHPVRVVTPYVPYLRSDKIIEKDGYVEQPLYTVITSLKNIEFISTNQHIKATNVKPKIVNETFNAKMIDENNLIICADASEYERLNGDMLPNVYKTTKERTPDGIKHVLTTTLLDAINECTGEIIIRDDLLSYGGTVVSLVSTIEQYIGMNIVHSVHVDFCDNLYLKNPEFPHIEVVALHTMGHEGYLK